MMQHPLNANRLNLQLLAAAATMATTTSALSEELQTFYDRQLLERALPSLVYAQFGQERPIPRNGGKTIDFRAFASLSAATTALTEGVTPDGSELSTSNVTATIAQYGDFVRGSDLIDLTSIDPIITETAQLLGEQAGLTLDTICRDVLAAGTTVQYAGGRTSRVTVAATDKLTVDEVRKAVRTLKRNKCRPFSDGYYVAIVEPGTTYDLQDDADWVAANNYANTGNIFSGEIGRIAKVRFVESTNAIVFADAGASGIDVYGTLILGANAYGHVPLSAQTLQFIFHPIGSAGSTDPLNQRWTSAWKVATAYLILNQLFMVRIEHAVTA